MACSRAQGHLRANDRGRLEQALLLRRQPVDARRQHRLHRGRHLHGSAAAAPGDRRPASPTSTPVSTRVRTLSSRKKGLPSVRAISSCLSGARLGSSPSRACEECLGAGRGQRVEPQLRVVGLAAPAVLVLRAIVDQEQEPGRGQALDQAVEQGLRLGIDPVQILKDQQQGLHLAFAQQQALERVERALAALRRIERAETGCPSGRASSSASSAGRVSWSVSSSVSTCPVTLARMVRASSRVLHVAVALEQVDDGEVGRGLAVGHRGALQHPPALGAVGVDKLIDQAGLAHARLPRPGRPPGRGPLRPAPGPAAGPASSGCRPTKRVRPRAAAACKRRRSALAPTSSKTSTGSSSPLTGTGPSGGDLHQALHQPQGGRRSAGYCPGVASLFHARRQVGGLAHGGVVHVQVVANGPHHHLAGVEPHAHAAARRPWVRRTSSA